MAILVIRTAAWTLTLLLMGGCNSTKPATLFHGDEQQIKDTIMARTGDGVAASFVHALPSGTLITVLDDESSDSTAKIRIEQGEFKGQEATVARNSLRPTE
jgi:hypothetical protein